MSLKIGVFDSKPYVKRFLDQANEAFRFQLEYFEASLKPSTCNLAQGFDVVCGFVNDDLCCETIQKLQGFGVKLIAMRCAGYNNVCLKEAIRLKLPVVNVPHYSPYAVAEHAVTLMLALNRKVHIAYQRTRDNNFTLEGLLGFDMHGKTVGIIGLGGIGKEVAKILKGFGMRVIFYDKYPDEKFAKKFGLSLVELNTLYKESDIITLHCPLTPRDVHMIKKEAFAKMKEGVMIINTSRGALIHAAELIDALKSRKVGACGLDVYEEESSVFFEDLSGTFISDDVLARLQTFPNVLITSHQAFFTKEALEAISKTTLLNIQEYSENRPLTNEVKH